MYTGFVTSLCLRNSGKGSRVGMAHFEVVSRLTHLI